jgi:hypothetical protein
VTGTPTRVFRDSPRVRKEPTLVTDMLTLYPPTPEECADFEAYLVLSNLSSWMEDERTDRVASGEAVEYFLSTGYPKITDQSSLAAAVRPSGVKPHAMRFQGRSDTRRGYSFAAVWDGLERIFRRYVGEPSGIVKANAWPRTNDSPTSRHFAEFFSRSLLADAWGQFCTDGDGSPDYSDPFPSTPEEYRAKRFGKLFSNVDKRRPPRDEDEERRPPRGHRS